MIQTASFSWWSKHPSAKGGPGFLLAKAISLSVPEWYFGQRYFPLVPSGNDLYLYRHGDIDQAEYTVRYLQQLAQLDAKQVYRDLGDGAIMLCWEKPGKFCHRRLAAEWLERELGIEVPEVGTREEAEAKKGEDNGKADL
ncbi:MAG: hypothetical protein WC683_04760 [bacterium]